MADLKMVLKDSTEISLSEFTFPLHIVVVRDTKDEILALWDKLTDEALEEVTIQEAGETLFTFLHCSVTGEQIVVNTDSTLTGHYYLDGERQSTTADSEYETAAKILLGEEE